MNETDRTRKILVLTLNRDDYALLEKMHSAARQKIPGLTLDDTVSALLTEALKHIRVTQPLPALPV